MEYGMQIEYKKGDVIGVEIGYAKRECKSVYKQGMKKGWQIGYEKRE